MRLVRAKRDAQRRVEVLSEHRHLNAATERALIRHHALNLRRLGLDKVPIVHVVAVAGHVRGLVLHVRCASITRCTHTGTQGSARDSRRRFLEGTTVLWSSVIITTGERVDATSCALARS